MKINFGEIENQIWRNSLKINKIEVGFGPTHEVCIELAVQRLIYLAALPVLEAPQFNEK